MEEGAELLFGGNIKDYLPVARKYVDEKAIPQIRELIAMYDPDIMWFDTPHKLPQEECIRIVEATREASPDIIINGRAISGFDRYDYYNTAIVLTSSAIMEIVTGKVFRLRTILTPTMKTIRSTNRLLSLFV